MIEDLVNEPTRKCDYCGEYHNKEEMFKHDDLDVCESCHEGAIA